MSDPAVADRPTNDARAHGRSIWFRRLFLGVSLLVLGFDLWRAWAFFVNAKLWSILGF